MLLRAQTIVVDMLYHTIYTTGRQYINLFLYIKVYQTLSSIYTHYREGSMIAEKYYRIKEVARILGISKQTIIRYETRGLFPSARRNALNGWREYTQKEIAQLKVIMGRPE